MPKLVKKIVKVFSRKSFLLYDMHAYTTSGIDLGAPDHENTFTPSNISK